MTAAAGGTATAMPRVRLVETSEALPGLLPFQAWDALATATVVYVRDREQHPAAAHLYYAGIDLETLEPVAVPPRELDLSSPGGPVEQGRARALLDAAERDGDVVYLLGPEDDRFGQLVGMQAARRGAEVEFVFLVQQPRGTEVLRLAEVMARLRDPNDGCPWDLEQDHRSLAPYLIEEAYELLDAIDRDDDADMAEELGDVLLQVVFHAQVAADRRAFGIDDVARGIADKLVRRHPHVFADVEVADADEVTANWETLKAEEKQRSGPFDGVPAALPALALAEKLQSRAAKQGFDWRGPDEPRARVQEELSELAAAGDTASREEELGDLLGAVVGLARHLGIDPETAMRRAAAKFRARFEAVLELAEQRGLDPRSLDRDGWLGLWEDVKSADDEVDGHRG